MTNKPMLSVERELLERAVSAVIVARGPGSPTERDLRAILDNPSECRCKRYGKDNPHWPCPVHAEPAAQHQGEPVAICRLWNEGGSGERTSVEFIGEPCADGTLLYAEQPAPVAVVMPERMKFSAKASDYAWAHGDGWNACIEELARLNGVKP